MMAHFRFCRLTRPGFAGVPIPRGNLSKFTNGIALVCGLLLLGALSARVGAEGRGSIGGVIRSAAEGVGSHRIMLIRFGPENDVQRTPGETDAQGEFLFENLSTDGRFTYFVGIRYEGQLHRSEPISLQEAPRRTDLVLNLDDPSAQALPPQPAAPTLRITSHLMVIVKRNERLEVREIVKLLNPGGEAFTGRTDAAPGSPHGAFHLSLPQGYYDLQGIEGGLDSSQVRQHDTGLFYTAPLEPGEHSVMFTYALPLQGRVMMIVPRRTLATDVFDVLVEEASLAATSELASAGRVAIEPHVFTHFRGVDLPARSRSWLQLAQRAAVFPALRVGVYGLVVALSLAGMLAPCARTRRTNSIAEPPQVRPTPQQIHELHKAEQLLLQRISQLERQRQGGTIGDADYHLRRRDYKAQLCGLLWQLRQVGEHQNQRV
jgi:hypothetical protein